MNITVLGAASCTPDPGGETASFCLDGRVLIDSGWHAAGRLAECGLPPEGVRAVLLTHCHHDHYLGLAELIFYQGLQAGHRACDCSLDVYGPAGEVLRVVEDAWRFLQADRFPELRYPVRVHDVSSEQSLSVEGFSVEARGALHNVPALHYRLSDSGSTVVFSGDTAYNPDVLIPLARGADLLVHEASHGEASTRECERCFHSGALEAADIARLAEVRALWLVHLSRPQYTGALQVARARFPATEVPVEGRTYAVPLEGTADGCP